MAGAGRYGAKGGTPTPHGTIHYLHLKCTHKCTPYPRPSTSEMYPTSKKLNLFFHDFYRLNNRKKRLLLNSCMSVGTYARCCVANSSHDGGVFFAILWGDCLPINPNGPPHAYHFFLSVASAPASSRRLQPYIVPLHAVYCIGLSATLAWMAYGRTTILLDDVEADRQ